MARKGRETPDEKDLSGKLPRLLRRAQCEVDLDLSQGGHDALEVGYDEGRDNDRFNPPVVTAHV